VAIEQWDKLGHAGNLTVFYQGTRLQENLPSLFLGYLRQMKQAKVKQVLWLFFGRATSAAL
jgi:hypothetical protein